MSPGQGDGGSDLSRIVFVGALAGVFGLCLWESETVLFRATLKGRESSFSLSQGRPLAFLHVLVPCPSPIHFSFRTGLERWGTPDSALSLVQGCYLQTLLSWGRGVIWPLYGSGSRDASIYLSLSLSLYLMSIPITHMLPNAKEEDVFSYY